MRDKEVKQLEQNAEVKSSRQATKFVDFFKNTWNKEGHPISVFSSPEKWMQTAEAEAQLKALIAEIKAEELAPSGIQQFIEHLEKYGPYLFTYLNHPDVIPNNNAEEREISPFVFQPKTSGNVISPEVMNILLSTCSCIAHTREMR
ncbi:MAG: IS66 family transposase [Promethearchaeota archaeon]